MRIYVTINGRRLFEREDGPLPHVGQRVQSHEGPRPVLNVEHVVVAKPGVDPVDRITLGDVVDPLSW